MRRELSPRGHGCIRHQLIRAVPLQSYERIGFRQSLHWVGSERGDDVFQSLLVGRQRIARARGGHCQTATPLPLRAATSACCSTLAEVCNPARSAASSGISITRSTPFRPTTHGKLRYTPEMPY